MIRCEQFIDGSFKDIGYRFVTTDHVRQILTKRSLAYLRNLTSSDTIIQTLLPEGYVAISHVKNGRDENGRKTVWNHTILVPLLDYFDAHKNHDKNLFQPYFITNQTEMPRSLEPVKVKA